MFLKAPKSGGSQPRPALSEYSEYFVVLFGAPEPGEAQVFLGTPPEASVDRLDRSTGSGLKPGQWFFQWFLKGSHLHGKEISRPRHQASAVCWFSWEENPTTTQLLILYVCLSAAALAASGFSIAWFRAMFSLPTQCLRTSPSILGTMTYASLRFHLAAHLMGLLNPKQCFFGSTVLAVLPYHWWYHSNHGNPMTVRPLQLPLTAGPWLIINGWEIP